MSVILNGFDGVSSYINNNSLKLDSGITLKTGDVYLDGKVEIDQMHHSELAGNNLLGDLMIKVEADTVEERLAIFKDFLDEVGLTCRRDIDVVLAGVLGTVDTLKACVSYYKWQGFGISRASEIGNALNESRQKVMELYNCYDRLKNVEEIGIDDTSKLELRIPFSPVTVGDGYSVDYDGERVTVTNLELTATDNMLFVKDEPYKVGLAFRSLSGEIIHVDVDNTETTPYSGEDALTVSASELSIAVPTLKPGEYTLVAYVATSDSVRSSVCATLVATNVTETVFKVENIVTTVSKADDGTLKVVSIGENDLYVVTDSDTQYTAKSLFDMLAAHAYTFGNPIEGTLEYYDMLGEEYVSFDGIGDVPTGEYRISYKVGDDVHYVYATIG